MHGMVPAFLNFLKQSLFLFFIGFLGERRRQLRPAGQIAARQFSRMTRTGSGLW
jgi:hypothetical protein